MTVNHTEEFTAKLPALALLSTLGYQFIPPIDCQTLKASSHNKGQKNSHQVILVSVLTAFLAKHRFSHGGKTHQLSEAAISKIVGQLSAKMNLGLLKANESLYDDLTLGITVTEFIDGKKVAVTVPVIDWHNSDNNLYHCTEEYVVVNTAGNDNRIIDIVCFVNGLPLAAIETKKPDSNKAGQPTVDAGVSQHIRNQGQHEIPQFFAYSQILLSVNGNKGLYGTCGTAKEFWAKWKEEQITEAQFKQLKNQKLTTLQLNLLFKRRSNDIKQQYLALVAGELTVTDQDRLIISLLRPDRLLEMTQLFTLFDKKAGKIVARYQQVFGIKALVERVNRYDNNGAREGGVIWHTTGSGKSYTMVFLAKAMLVLDTLAQCRLILVTDRVDLEDQLSKTFNKGGAFGEHKKKLPIAKSAKDLARQIGKDQERIIFSIINKFGAAADYPECHNDSPNIIVLVDEGHRSQNGENNIKMQQALPKAAFIAFTGTPLLKDDKTENKFGKIIHSYTMQQAGKDQTVTPLLYEERMPELSVNEKAIDAWFERATCALTAKQKSDLKLKFAQKGQIYQTEGRIELIAYDISDHFQLFKQQGLKGQLACESKVSAIRYKNALDKIGLVTSKVVISAPDTREGHEEVDQESKDIVQNWWRQNVGKTSEKEYTKAIIKQFANDPEPDLLIVVDKLLTGFDEPKNTVLYIDKPLKGHNLIQAIARVNRLHEGKPFGYLMDYRGILKELDTTIEKYQNLAERTQAGYDVADIKGLYSSMETEYKKLPGLHKALWQFFAEVKNQLDMAALRQALAPKIKEVQGQLVDLNLKKRDEFYQTLTDFTRCMNVALQSKSYFFDKSFDNKRELYKKDLKFFISLRRQIQEDANETIDYSQYAEQIADLLDKHIGGVEIKSPEGVYRVDNLGKDAKPEVMNDDEARNKTATITTRVGKTITQDLDDDPYTQAYFSELLKKAIADAEAMFDAPIKQYLLLSELEEQVKERKVPGTPEVFCGPSDKRNLHAQAYFGLFKLLYLEQPELTPLADEQLTEYAFEIDEIVRTAMQEYSINPLEIEKAIRNKLITKLYPTLGVENAQKIAEQVCKLTNGRIAKGHRQ